MTVDLAGPTEKPGQKPNTAKRIGCLALGIYFIPACGLGVISGGQYTFLVFIPFRIAFGIITYPGRVLPLVTVDWGGVGTFFIALALLALVGHALLVGISRSFGAGRSWSLRATAILIATVLTLWVAAMAVAGVGHQVGWLIATKEPLTDNPWDESACPHSRQRAPAAWLEHWRILPLDGEPALASKRYIAIVRNPDDPAIQDRRPRVCGDERGGGMGGQPIDDAEVTELLYRTLSESPASAP